MGPLNYANNKEIESFGGNGFRQKCMEKSLLTKVAATYRGRCISGLAFRVYSQKQMRNLNSTFLWNRDTLLNFSAKCVNFRDLQWGILRCWPF